MTKPGRAPGAAQEQSRKILLHLLGGHRLFTVLVVILFLLSLAWLSDALYEWLCDLGRFYNGEPVNNWFPPHRVIAIIVFGVVVFYLWWQARDALRHYRPRVTTVQSPAHVQGLILFLSNLKTEDADKLQSDLDQLHGMDDFRTQHGKLNWLMPLEAIAHHASKLRWVIVITSRGDNGSAMQTKLFNRLVTHCFPDADLCIKTIDKLAPKYNDGLDFEDVKMVSEATDDAFLALRSHGLDSADILIDITGGKKTNATAATAVALAEGRRIQYVACDRESDDCHLCTYDVTYDA